MIPDWQKAIESTLAEAASSGRTSIVMIGTTARSNNPPLLIAPARESRQFVACSFVVSSARQLLEICAFADGKADYIFIDAENKIQESQRFVPLAYSVVKHSKVKTYKGNDVTVLACDMLISSLLPDLSDIKSVIVGAGNIGCKLALLLAERGAHAAICRRDSKSPMLADALNEIKNRYAAGTVSAAESPLEAAENAKLLIGATQGNPAVTAEMISALSPNALIIDAGIGTLHGEAVRRANALGHLLYRLDVRLAFPCVIDGILAAERFLSLHAGRIEKNGRGYVSGGVIGVQGDIVVDSIHQPTRILGIADGAGGMTRIYNPEDDEAN